MTRILAHINKFTRQLVIILSTRAARFVASIRTASKLELVIGLACSLVLFILVYKCTGMATWTFIPVVHASPEEERKAQRQKKWVEACASQSRELPEAETEVKKPEKAWIAWSAHWYEPTKKCTNAVFHVKFVFSKWNPRNGRYQADLSISYSRVG